MEYFRTLIFSRILGKGLCLLKMLENNGFTCNISNKARLVCLFQDLAYGCGDQTYPDEEVPIPEDCIIKIGALLKVFTTVVRSMGEEFSPSKQITREYITQVSGPEGKTAECLTFKDTYKG